MGYLRRCVQRVGFVATLLIGGVLGGLLAPVPSEAASLSIDGVNITLLDTTGTGAGNKYTCETGYNQCWFLTASPTATRPIAGGVTGSWTLANVSTSNRARLRINDVGGPPNTNVDKMNFTGMILTPATTAKRTAKIIITHTYASGQGVGDYQFGMGATGHFQPVGTDTVLQDQFILTGKGKFNTADAEAQMPGMKIDDGVVDNVPALVPGKKGIITKTVSTRSVKTPCNTDSLGSCKPTIKFEYEITTVGDALFLTDSMIAAGISCTAAQVNPLIPPLLRALMQLIDPSGNRPTHISGLNAWIDDMAVKYKLNAKQLKKVADLKTALAKWFTKTTCPGKVTQVLEADAASGVAAGIAAGGELLTTCADNNTCGTITITKTTTQATNATFTFDISETSSGSPYLTKTIEMGGTNSASIVFTVDTDRTYTITETLPDGWSSAGSSCEDEGTIGVAVPANGNVNCSFHNSAGPPPPTTGTITITKQTSGPSGGETTETFTFNISGPSLYTETISMGGTNNKTKVVTVKAGAYDISEVELIEWSLTHQSCTDENGSTLIGPPLTNLVVPAGGNLTCTFKNSFVPPPPGTGTITIQKFAALTGDPCGPQCPPIPQTFRFEISDGLTINEVRAINIVTNSNGTDFREVVVALPPGVYRVSERDPSPSGWTQGQTNCNGQSIPPGVPCSINVTAGNDFPVVFNNTFLLLQ